MIGIAGKKRKACAGSGTSAQAYEVIGSGETMRYSMIETQP